MAGIRYGMPPLFVTKISCATSTGSELRTIVAWKFDVFANMLLLDVTVKERVVSSSPVTETVCAVDEFAVTPVPFAGVTVTLFVPELTKSKR